MVRILESEITVDVKGFTDTMLSLDAFDPLLRYNRDIPLSDYSLLQHEDEAVPILSAQACTLLFSTSSSVQISIPALKTYFTWLSTLCKKPHISMQDLAVQFFAGALRSSQNRLVFWSPELTCSNEVVELLKTKRDLQLQYHTLLVVWLITFEKKIAKELNK
jgi:V-type H+-transporting ATPase subunit H